MITGWEVSGVYGLFGADGGGVDKVMDQLQDPIFWFSVFFAGIIVNLISSFLRDAYDKYSAKRSEKKRARVSAEEKKRNDRVDKMASSPERLFFAQFKEVRLYLLSIVLMTLPPTLLGTILFLIPELLDIRFADVAAQSLAGSVSTVSALMGFMVFRRARTLGSEIYDAKKAYLKLSGGEEDDSL